VAAAAATVVAAVAETMTMQHGVTLTDGQVSSLQASSCRRINLNICSKRDFKLMDAIKNMMLQTQIAGGFCKSAVLSA